MPELVSTGTKLVCYHCGDTCPDKSFHIPPISPAEPERYFCCFGCKTVYEILNENQLCEYYDISAHPGISQKNKVTANKYAVLNDEKVRGRFINFSDGKQSRVTFYLPQMHCSSCIWLLEHLYKLNRGIYHAQVNFPKREISISFDESEITLADVAALLDAVGYEPHISLHDLDKKQDREVNKNRIVKIGIAGFAFGNVMLFSFPDYVAGGSLNDPGLVQLFHYLSLLLSIPVFFYCANEFYISSWKSIKNKFLNIDVPIALAIIITFARSLYAIFIEKEAGYFDSMTGIVFFMLLGRFFQDRTYKTISFDRDYRSYFPLAVTVVKGGEEIQTPLSELKNGDLILVRNHELIPADAILVRGRAHIDYSFVTGEAEPVEKHIGELIYAGGKQVGSALELKLIKEVSQSYLTQLWNDASFKKTEHEKDSFVQQLGRYFALIVLVISAIACAYWFFQGDVKRGLDALVTPMIIACPCALLLSATFTNGNAMRLMGKAGLYLKNALVLEKLTKIDTIVFDKTGTLTQSNAAQVMYEGEPLGAEQKMLICALASQSVHPYSKAIVQFLGRRNGPAVMQFNEFPGRGIEGFVDGVKIKIGNAGFIGLQQHENEHGVSFISINGIFYGRFNFRNKYREGVYELINRLDPDYELWLLSGDNSSDKPLLKPYFNEGRLLFNNTPHDKLHVVKQLQLHHKHVLMLGDGLNDAGALSQSDVGFAVAADINNFTPASDGVIDVKILSRLDKLFSYAKFSRQVIIGSFILSILYNAVGLFYAVQGNLSPVIAAMLMPLSTITIVSFTTGATTLFAKKLFKKNE